MATIPEERNALAELAKELERFSAENKGLFAKRNYLILYKAQRIIAELAKIWRGPHLFSPFVIECTDAALRCRAIAEEEGAKE